MAEIQGQGQGQSWQPGLPPGVHHTEKDQKGHKTHKHAPSAHTKDVEEKAQVHGAKHSQVNVIASGFRYATLSEAQLDSANPADPHLAEPSVPGNSPNPPTGPQGTGNPFFKSNPMTVFFSTFLMMMQSLKEVERAQTRLTLIELEATKDTGLGQAKATLEAGKVAAKADFEQAIISGVQAGVDLLSLGKMMSIDKKVNKMMQEGRKEALQEASKLEKRALDEAKLAQKLEAEDGVAQKFLDEGIGPKFTVNKSNVEKAKKEMETSKKEWEEAKTTEDSLKGKPDKKGKDVTDARDAQTLRVKKEAIFKQKEKEFNEMSSKADEDTLSHLKNKHERAKKNLEHVEKQLTEAQDKLEKNLIKKSTAQIKKEREEIDTLMIKRKEAIKDEKLFEYKIEEHKGTLDKNKLRNDRITQQSKIKDAKTNASESRKKSEEHWDAAEEQDLRGSNLKARQMYYQHKMQLKQNWDIFAQFSQNTLQAVSKWRSGLGTEQKAFWDAQGQILQTYNSMLQKGLDSAIQSNHEAYSQANDLAQALMGMSDKEQQSMHWVI